MTIEFDDGVANELITAAGTGSDELTNQARSRRRTNAEDATDGALATEYFSDGNFLDTEAIIRNPDLLTFYERLGNDYFDIYDNADAYKISFFKELLPTS